jgi:hypothetical protein
MERYNELEVLEYIQRPDTEKYKSWNTNKWVHCICSCGKEIDLPYYGVKNGIIKSCGHLRAEKAQETLAEIKKDNPTPTAINITYNGETLNVSEWSEKTGIPRTTILYRLNKELPLSQVFQEYEVRNEQKD